MAWSFFMTELTDLGFSRDVIAETIISTYDNQRQANAAPMGVTIKNAKQIVLRIYTSSLTYKNLQVRRCAVVNVVTDPDLFYRAAFKHDETKSGLPREWFEKTEFVDAPRLLKAKAHIEVVVDAVRPLRDGRAEITCEVKIIRASKILPKVYCRALFATIEAIIHATRVEVFMKHGDIQKKEQVLTLIGLIGECNNVVNRVAPNSRYSEIMEDLIGRINSWRVEGESLR
jgi:hypothetical protein